jgi:acyl-CoA thioester hydrolase
MPAAGSSLSPDVSRAAVGMLPDARVAPAGCLPHDGLPTALAGGAGMSDRKGLELRIDWSEIDAFGHVNNLAIMRYVQTSRVECLGSVGLMQSQMDAGVGPILASIHCQFRKPLFYPGCVTVFTRIEAIRTTSFHVRHEIHNDRGELAAEAVDVLVLYDFERKVKAAIPAELRVRLEKLA